MNTVLDVLVLAPWEGEVWVSGASKRGDGETQKRPDPVQGPGGDLAAEWAESHSVKVLGFGLSESSPQVE